MKINKITIRGEKQPSQSTFESADDLKLEEVYLLGSSTRGEAERHSIQLKKDQVVEFVFEDNTVWLSSDQTIQDVFPEAAALKSRSVDSDFEIPYYIQSTSDERGIGTVALKLLKVFTKKSIKKGVRELAVDLEKKQLDNKSGLYRLDASFQFFKDIPVSNSKPFLLFLHGTNSSTSGSFGELAGTELWKYIFQNYEQNVLAFQHETLTKSPLQNVAELVKQLPSNAVLHLISHSRGGLVGDIVSRFCVDDENNAGFSAEEINYLKKEGRDEDIKYSKAIKDALKAKNISVQKFIRVACPASGTTLASERLDNFFNVTFNLIGLAIGGPANPVYNAFKNLLASVVDCKEDVSILPGLEAMNPDSPFIKVLNYPRPAAAIDSPLAVISGNSRVNLSFKALVVLASKLFFDSKNDLVVNTASMYNGAKRIKMMQYFFDEGATVDHFHYFKNPKTSTALLDALRTTDDALIPGFVKLEQGASMLADRNAILKLDGGQVFKNTVTGKRPIAVLLPGIMGSNLSKNGKLIWINYFRFIGGELNDLRITEKGVEAPSLIKTSYKKLADHLSANYDVVTFAFDWRQQLNDCAKLLNEKIIELLAYGQPIKLIGHSMGGVLIRDFILTHPDTWQRLNNSSGFRLLFLGSPLGGSFRIPYVLYGKDPIIDKISKIDIFHSKKQLLEIFSNFPGLLSLLPLSDDDQNDFAKEETWKKMSKANGDAAWPIPAKKQLDTFKTYRDFINENVKNIDYSNAVYIAGRDNSTPSGYEIDENNNLVFFSTAAGDQSVTWETGIPKKMIENNSVYYSDASHGALSNDPSLFKSIDEILEHGSTLLLKKTKPVIRGAELQFRTPVVNDFDLSAEGVENTILGLGEEKVTEAGEVPIRVSISNGDLKYSSYPLMAGHFINDGILYAEKAIDYNLRGVLTERYQLGLYPGEIGTSEVVITHQKDFNGAIIVGLGDPGSLTAYQLTQSVEQGVAKYLLYLNSKAPHTTNGVGIQQVGVSSLAIACSYGGLSVEKSIRAIIMGVQNANTKIRQTLREGAKTITHLEFIEQYQDRALGCLYVLNEIEKEDDHTVNIVFEKKRIKKLLGSRERLPLDNTDEWWTRINVKLKEYEIRSARIKGMQFNISTGGAREEQRDLFTSREMIQELINDLSGNNQWTPQLAKTIFELLVPNDFKEQLKKQANINWIVDKDTASYPWELLQDSTHNAKPLCINAGMVRQLATSDYRMKINSVTKDSALIIADPDLKGFANQLQGALQEGELVNEILGSTDFTTTKISRGSVSDIIQALFSDDYKIIHLAGHGVFNEDPSKGSGMLIGDNVFLSTREICQMSSVPELVFVNCCHLGKTDGAAENLYRNRFKLAANIGTQLIENGVKVVIAAGWAVDDAAALEFTDVFYQCMFNGEEFGQAVLQARKIIYEKYKYTNTWGAYQCYGDQFYTLRRGYKKQPPKEFVIAREAEIELSNLLNKLEITGYTTEGHLAELNAIATAVDKANIRNGEITELEALIYGGLCMYEQAMIKYESLLKMENASFSFSAMEKYCNIRPKFYVSEYGKNKNNQQELLAKVDNVINDLNLLINYSPTSERLNMLGSAYKDKALISSVKTQKVNAYKQAALQYYKAYNQKKEAYSLTNWLEIENILVLLEIRKWGQVVKMENTEYTLPTIKDAVKDLDNMLDALTSSSPDELSYWEWASAANIRLCLLMLDYKTGRSKLPTYEETFDLYKETWDKAGSKGKKLGEIDHFNFLTDALSLSKKKTAIAMKAKISDMRNQLERIL
ncbi:CHAT domain-containing protein [Terrimonas pollutisoli]|uniref:CHAT domain-containing protein n=1 Tax=Terrimonas pollutisoli TaxID=3034147 RepID=UPI0023ECD92C|nr:CHAT domain-containing protein [Terrimonas sp. H1YJ31]